MVISTQLGHVNHGRVCDFRQASGAVLASYVRVNVIGLRAAGMYHVKSG